MKFNRTAFVALAGAATVIVFYSASTQMRFLVALAPKSAEASIDQLAAARYQQYAPADFVGEKTIARNVFSWQHETWTGDDKPYREARQEIDAAIATGSSPMQLAHQYEAQAQKNSEAPLDQFRWGYSLWKTINPISTSAEKQANGLGTFFALAKIPSPNAYGYARLRYLVSYHSGELTALGERLLRRDSQDVDVKAHLALDYTTPGPEPYNLKAKNRAVQLSKELISANPKRPGCYAVLAEAYYASYYVCGHHREDALAVIAALKKYLSLAMPNEAFYEDAKRRLSDMEQRVGKK